MANQIEISDPDVLEALLDEAQLESLKQSGVTVRKIILEGDRSSSEIEEGVTELASSPDHRSLRRRAALGDVVAGIAHQSRNIMTGVLSFAQIAQRRNKDEKIDKLLDKIEAESVRCVELLVHVLILARSRDAGGGGQLEPCFPAQILSSAANLVEPRMQEGSLHFTRLNGESLPTVLGDSKALRDVFVNLLQNAADATPAGGTVALSTEVRSDHLAVIVDDSGPGVPLENRKKVFAPSFSTKGIGKGTGLGLAVSEQVVSEHSGSVMVEDSPEGGARFVVLLPIASEEEA